MTPTPYSNPVPTNWSKQLSKLVNVGLPTQAVEGLPVLKALVDQARALLLNPDADPAACEALYKEISEKRSYHHDAHK